MKYKFWLEFEFDAGDEPMDSKIAANIVRTAFNGNDWPEVRIVKTVDPEVLALIGNVVDGVTGVVGFADTEDATEWASQRLDNIDWIVVPCEVVEDWS